MGPVMIGYLTDHLFRDPAALGKSMSITLGTSGVCAVLAGLVAWREAKAVEQQAERPDTSPSPGHAKPVLARFGRSAA
jgi:hypothetical protein